jgi:prepilin-type N-terminal cleavage/methylation domain-containing protein
MKIIKDEKGFTLIEVIAAMAILSIILFTFIAFFTNGFKSIAKIGLSSNALYETQSNLEVFPTPLPAGTITDNTKPLIFVNKDDATKKITIQGKIHKVPINGSNDYLEVFIAD